MTTISASAPHNPAVDLLTGNLWREDFWFDLETIRVHLHSSQDMLVIGDYTTFAEHFNHALKKMIASGESLQAERDRRRARARTRALEPEAPADGL